VAFAEGVRRDGGGVEAAGEEHEGLHGIDCSERRCKASSAVYED